jgi:UDP-N-acetylglucosamine acyltransferase
VAVIHPAAVIDDSAQLGADVDIGPFSVIGPNVVIGDGTRIGPHVVIERDTRLGRACRVSPGAVLGGDPQDLKFGGELAPLEVGDRTVIRECVTLNRGTAAHGRTEIGSDCLIMAYTHVAHDCIIGNHVVLANAVQMGGHVEIEDWAIVGGLTAIHQFARIGTHAMVGGDSAVRKDVPPYVKASGHPLRIIGLNAVGLRRRGFTPEAQRALRDAHRLLFQSKLNVSQALEQIRAQVEQLPEVERLLRFVDASQRGIAV